MCIIVFIFAVEAPSHEEKFYVNGVAIPDAAGLWSLMEEALAHRRAVVQSGGRTDWYYEVSAVWCY